MGNFSISRGGGNNTLNSAPAVWGTCARCEPVHAKGEELEIIPGNPPPPCGKLWSDPHMSLAAGPTSGGNKIGQIDSFIQSVLTSAPQRTRGENHGLSSGGGGPTGGRKP